MNNLQRQPSPVSHALRMGDADSFIMDSEFFQPVLRASQTPPRDHHHLRRRVSHYQDMDAWVTNENMCFALWSLMSRS